MSNQITIPILYEDDFLAVVNKPPGLVVNNSQTVTEFTLQDWWQGHLQENPPTLQKESEWGSLVPEDFLYEYGSPQEVFTERGGIVHRLDKETSGIIVLAKDPGSLAHLLRQFRLREVEKMYTCLVHGKFQFPEGVITLPLGRSTQNRTRFQVTAEGRVAETRYQVHEFFPHLDIEKIIQEAKQGGKTSSYVPNFKKKALKIYQGFSLVQCWPKTGRTHQIRVHLSHLKHPIVSDTTYLGKKRMSIDEVWCPRLFLHASTLKLTHPRTGQVLNFSVELWPDLQKAFQYLLKE